MSHRLKNGIRRHVGVALRIQEPPASICGARERFVRFVLYVTCSYSSSPSEQMLLPAYIAQDGSQLDGNPCCS